MNPQLASALRWVIVLVAGFLVAHGYLGSEQRDSFVSAAVEVAAGAAALVSLVWSIRNNSSTGRTVRAALALPQHSTPFDLKSAPKLGGFGDLLARQAISTVFALIRDKVNNTRFTGYLIQLRDALNEAYPPAE